MKTAIVCILTVIMLVVMILPADIAAARGHGGTIPTATNKTAIESPLVADFDFELDCSHCGSKTVRFTDRTTGGTEPYQYDWDFGDGTPHNSEQDPTHSYATNGTFAVILTVTDEARPRNVDSESQTVIVGATVTADFESAGNISPTGVTTTWPRCIDGCTAKDARVTKIWLVVRGCTGTGGDATADIYVTFSNNAKRYCFVFVADFWIDGVLSPENDDLSYELGNVPAKTDYTVKVATIAWPCGAKLEVKDILLMWQSNNGDCQYNCGEYKAPSKCYFSATGPSETPPVIISVTQSSDHPCAEEDVVIIAHVTDDDGTVTSVDLTYDSTTISMSLTSGTAEDGYWEATILGQPAGTTLTIIVTAEDNDGNTVSTSPHDKTWIDCDYLDGWYEDGDTYTECDGDDVCTYQDWVYLDYECVDGGCVPTETDWRTDLIDCESCDDGDPCTIDTCLDGECIHTAIDCDYLDGWVEDGDAYTKCDGDLVCTYQDMAYLDYECVDGECVPTKTDWRTDLIGCEDCPADYYTDWVYYCDGDSIWRTRDFHDYYCFDGNCLEDVIPESEWYQDCDDGNPCTIDTCVDGQCVHVALQPVANAGNDVTISSGQSTDLDGSASYVEGCEAADGHMEYRWSGGGLAPSWAVEPTVTVSPAVSTTYTLEVRCSALPDCTDSDDVVVTVRVPVTPAGGGGGCPTTKYLTVDWEGNNTTKPIYRNDRLTMDLLGPSSDDSHSLLLKRGTHAPTVDGRTHYLIVIREVQEIPTLPENLTAIVVFNITPVDAAFDRDIFLTIGIDELPENALNVTMDYYDDFNGVWVPLEYEAGESSGVAELTLSAPINHFSIFGVLAELAPPPPPAHFKASGLNIAPSVEKIWERLTFMTKTGETVSITATITNDGGEEGTFAAALKLNGQTVDTATVTLAAGQTKQVSFTRSGLDYGQYDVDVAGLTGEFRTSRTIAWWLIILIIVAVGLIIWGVVWRKRRRRARQEV